MQQIPAVHRCQKHTDWFVDSAWAWPPPVTCVWICRFYGSRDGGPRRPGLSRTVPAGHWGTLWWILMRAGGGDSVNDSSVHFLSLPRQTNLRETQTNESNLNAPPSMKHTNTQQIKTKSEAQSVYNNKQVLGYYELFWTFWTLLFLKTKDAFMCRLLNDYGF